MFEVLEMSLTVMERLAQIEAKVRVRRKSLADQIGRAAESIGLNISEGRQRAGLDKPDLYRKAAGSAGELTTAADRALARLHLARRLRARRRGARSRARDAVAHDPRLRPPGPPRGAPLAGVSRRNWYVRSYYGRTYGFQKRGTSLAGSEVGAQWASGHSVARRTRRA